MQFFRPPVLAMRYTIWSRGRLLGETNLELDRCVPKVRGGFFHPAEEGHQLMPVACGVRPALRSMAAAIERDRATRSQADGHSDTRLKSTTEFADLAAAFVYEDALALELRGPEGAVIPTQYVGIVDLRPTDETQDRREFDRVLRGYEDRRRFEGDNEEIDADILAELEAEIAERLGEDALEWECPPEHEMTMNIDELELSRYLAYVELLDDRDVP